MEAFKKFGPWRQVGRGVASSTGNVWKSLGLAGGGGGWGAHGLRDRHTHRREGGGRGGGGSPANTGVDVWRHGDLEGRQGLLETRAGQPRAHSGSAMLPVTSQATAEHGPPS